MLCGWRCCAAGDAVRLEMLCGSGRLHDSAFHCVVENVEEEMMVLADSGFHARNGDPQNLKICKRGRWNQRMIIETVFSLFTNVLNLKKLNNRKWPALHARLNYVAAAFNICTAWTGEVVLKLAEFAL
jgi:hypothetical protein